MPQGSLVVVGTGIQLGHTTIEAKAEIEAADKVLFLVTDPVTADWITRQNATAEPLNDLYDERKDRLTTYLEMVERILGHVRDGKQVCAVFYGHPGVFVLPSHEAIRRARLEGYRARMLPGVSAEDCLFCDLGIDPATPGCQSFEATDFLVHERSFDPQCHLVLWQIGVIGDIGYKQQYGRDGLDVLARRLVREYGEAHEVIVYEAARYAVCDARVTRTTIAQLSRSTITPISTLYVGPRSLAVPNTDMMAELGIPASYVKRKADVGLGEYSRPTVAKAV